MVTVLPSPASAAPSDRTYSEPGARQPIDGVAFMQRFGYLPQSDIETGALRTEEELRKAIRKFQSWASIPVTGNMDKATLDKMASKRCGVADNIGSGGGHVRTKRWTTGP